MSLTDVSLDEYNLTSKESYGQNNENRHEVVLKTAIIHCIICTDKTWHQNSAAL